MSLFADPLNSLSRRVLILAVALFGSMVMASCSADVHTARTLHVPKDFATVQEAVDAAKSGDMVLIEDGTYHESVSVASEGITIRGMNRNSVVFDGQGKFSNGFIVTANGVTIQNLTIHSYQQNGIIFTGVLPSASSSGEYAGSAEGKVLDGYYVDYVTAYNNGLYGVYAFASRNGAIENSYVSGHPDSGFYVGQCNPCNAVLFNNIAENNAIGYYGTNASGNVYVINSIFRKNRLGIAPNSQRAEQLAPQESTVIAGNLVDDNDNPDAPKIPKGFFAAGIAVGGGTKNSIMKNRVTNHSGAGIILLSFNEFEPLNNVVSGNVLEKNKVDLVYAVNSVGGHRNCFEKNSFISSSPVNIEATMPCSGDSHAVSPKFELPVAPDGPNFQNVVKPGLQPTLDNASTTPWRAVVGEPSYPNVELITVPDAQ